MNRNEIMQRLREMVDQLERVPEEWFEEGTCPLLKVTLQRESGKDRITLIVGLTNDEDSAL